MSLILYSGTPGSYKSFHAVQFSLRWLRTGGNLITNFPLNYMHKLKKEPSGIYQCVDNFTLTVPYLMEFAKNYHHKSVHAQTLVVIDEASIKFNSRDFNMADRMQWINFFANHRHFNFNVILITQQDKMLDKQILGLIETECQNGYKSCMYFEKIFIFFDPGKPEMGIHCRMSGQGCRSFEKYSEFKTWKDLFTSVVFYDCCADNFCEKGNSTISRLDIAYDDFEGLIDLDAIAESVRNPLDRVVSWWKTAFVLEGVNLNTGEMSKTINFGVQQSDKFMTIYNKLEERKSKGIMPDVEIWNRAELKLRKNSAFSFASQVADGKSMLELYFLVLNNLVRSDNNKYTAKCFK